MTRVKKTNPHMGVRNKMKHICNAFHISRCYKIRKKTSCRNVTIFLGGGK